MLVGILKAEVQIVHAEQLSNNCRHNVNQLQKSQISLLKKSNITSKTIADNLNKHEQIKYYCLKSSRVREY